MRLARAAIAVVILSGCGIGLAPPREEAGPVEVGPVGPVFPRPGGGGPPIECRGLVRDHCVSLGSVEDGVGGVELREIDRVIVSCVDVCMASGGEFRIDVVVDGTTLEIGRGGYGHSP